MTRSANSVGCEQIENKDICDRIFIIEKVPFPKLTLVISDVPVPLMIYAFVQFLWFWEEGLLLGDTDDHCREVHAARTAQISTGTR